MRGSRFSPSGQYEDRVSCASRALSSTVVFALNLAPFLCLSIQDYRSLHHPALNRSLCYLHTHDLVYRLCHYLGYSRDIFPPPGLTIPSHREDILPGISSPRTQPPDPSTATVAPTCQGQQKLVPWGAKAVVDRVDRVDRVDPAPLPCSVSLCLFLPVL